MERIITPQEIFEDGSSLSLRPQSLNEYIGQYIYKGCPK